MIPKTYARKPGGTGTGKPIVTVSLGTVRANLGTTLKHFDGDVSGVHLALEIPVLVNIQLNANANIQITVTSTFEQEVRVDINVDGKEVWKVWKIFPYIADYKVTASLDLYEYTMHCSGCELQDRGGRGQLRRFQQRLQNCEKVSIRSPES